MSHQIKITKEQIAKLLESPETDVEMPDGQHPGVLFAGIEGGHPVDRLFTSVPGGHPGHQLFAGVAGHHPGDILFAGLGTHPVPALFPSPDGAHPRELFWASTAGDAVPIRKISLRPDDEGGLVLDLE